MKKITICTLSVLLALIPATLWADPIEDIIVVLDASGSMWGKVDGKIKMDVARAALKDVVKSMPPARRVGLIVYGHRSKGDCGDIEEVLPLSPVDYSRLSGIIDPITPKGMTPLSDSVKQAAELLKFTERKATVVLISDGVETCKKDPCEVGAELEKLGVDFTAHVIGFDVNKAEEQKGLRCLAENTGGLFLAAKDSGELIEALEKLAALPEVTPTTIPTATLTAAPTASATITPQPVPEVAMSAPKSGIKGTEIEIELTGEKNPGGAIQIFAKGKEKYLDYVSVREGSDKIFEPLRMRLPGTAGLYDLRWILDDEILAEQPVEVTDAEIKINAPEEVLAGTEVELGLSAPEGLDGHVYLYAEGSERYITYATVREEAAGGYSPVKLRMPAKSGIFEVIWKSGKEQSYAKEKIVVKDADKSLIVPAEVTQATEFSVDLKAPDGLAGHVYLYKNGKDKYITYASVYEDSVGGYKTLKMKAPATPGDYRLVWKSSREESLAEAAFKVVSAEISLDAGSEWPQATELTAMISGPENLSGHVYLYKAGKEKSITYSTLFSDPEGGYKPVKIRLPVETGDYDLVLRSSRQEELARTRIKVTQAEFAIESSPVVPLGEQITAEIKAPDNFRGHLYLFRKGQTKYQTYSSVVDKPEGGYKKIGLKAPKEPGEYLIKLSSSSGAEDVLAEAEIKVE